MNSSYQSGCRHATSVVLPELQRRGYHHGLTILLSALTDESWMNLVHALRRRFRRAAGTPESMKKEALANGQRKLAG